MTSAALSASNNRMASKKLRRGKARRQAQIRADMMAGKFTERRAEAFWNQVDKFLEPDDCWGWVGSFHRDRPYFIGKKAARVVWCLQHRKPFPKGKQAAHACRNRRCVNPDHIIPLTPRQHRIYDGENEPRKKGK